VISQPPPTGIASAGRRELALELVQEELLGGQGERRGGRPLEEARERQPDAAGSHGIEELENAPWSSYLVSARTIEVTPFEPAETRLLLTEPLKHSSLWRNLEAERPRFAPGFWREGGIERIHAETGGWPHLVQLVAETAVDLVNDSGNSAVDGALLERAFERAVVRGNNVFLELVEKESQLPGEWNYLRGFRTAEELPVPADEAIAHSLRRRRRLVIEEGGRFRLRVPIMGRWLRERLGSECGRGDAPRRGAPPPSPGRPR
jgi:hypothetical protein